MGRMGSKAWRNIRALVVRDLADALRNPTVPSSRSPERTSFSTRRRSSSALATSETARTRASHAATGSRPTISSTIARSCMTQQKTTFSYALHHRKLPSR